MLFGIYCKAPGLMTKTMEHIMGCIVRFILESKPFIIMKRFKLEMFVTKTQAKIANSLKTTFHKDKKAFGCRRERKAEKISKSASVESSY